MTGFHLPVRRWVISILCQQGLLMLAWISPPLLHSRRDESLIITSVYLFFFLNASAEYCGCKCLQWVTWAVYRA